MNRPSNLSKGKRIFSSFLLLLILLGSTVSSTLLFGLTISPQTAWGSHLAAPALETPTANACLTDTTPNFNWADVGGAASYRLEVDDDNAFGSVNYFATPTSSNQNDGGPFTEGTYFWHVATKGSGTDALGAYSATRTFHMNTVGPAGPTGGLPAATNDQTPLLTWNAVTDVCGVNRYIIEMSTSSATDATTGAFTGTIVALGGSSNIDGAPPATQKQATNTLAPGTYFWHLRTRDNNNLVGPYGPTFTLVIDITGPSVTASPTTGTFGAAGTSVTLSSESGALIFYTTDGTTPTESSTAYSSPIPITTTTTLKVIAKDAAGNLGPVRTETYTIDSTGPTVTATPASGTFGPSGTSVTLSSLDTDLDAIYYTDDGSTPDNTDTEYTDPISITTTHPYSIGSNNNNSSIFYR